MHESEHEPKESNDLNTTQIVYELIEGTITKLLAAGSNITPAERKVVKDRIQTEEKKLLTNKWKALLAQLNMSPKLISHYADNLVREEIVSQYDVIMYADKLEREKNDDKLKMVFDNHMEDRLIFATFANGLRHSKTTDVARNITGDALLYQIKQVLDRLFSEQEQNQPAQIGLDLLMYSYHEFIPPELHQLILDYLLPFYDFDMETLQDFKKQLISDHLSATWTSSHKCNCPADPQQGPLLETLVQSEALRKLVIAFCTGLRSGYFHDCPIDGYDVRTNSSPSLQPYKHPLTVPRNAASSIAKNIGDHCAKMLLRFQDTHHRLLKVPKNQEELKLRVENALELARNRPPVLTHVQRKQLQKELYKGCDVLYLCQDVLEIVFTREGHKYLNLDEIVAPILKLVPDKEEKDEPTSETYANKNEQTPVGFVTTARNGQFWAPIAPAPKSSAEANLETSSSNTKRLSSFDSNTL